MEEQVENPRAPVIEPGHTFGSVTDKISSIVLTRPTSNGWFVGFGVAFLLTMMLLFAIAYLFVKGVGIWGVTIPIGWGFAIVNFVWWIGIGHADFRHLASAAPVVAQLDQPLCRGDDPIRRRQRGYFPPDPRRTALARLLALSLSEHDASVAAIPQPVGVGRFRGFYLRHHLAVVLVHRADS